MKTQSFKEKKESKIIRYKELSEKYKSMADTLHERVKQMGEVLQGEPIKRGHHSEKRHRKNLQIMERYLDRSLSASGRAEYFEKKAKAAAENKSIRSDDPEAEEKLLQKLSNLQSNQFQMKRINKIVNDKKISIEERHLKLMDEFKMSDNNATQLLKPDYMGNIGFPKYKLQNNLAAIAATKKRLEQIAEQKQFVESYEVINGVALHVDPSSNRVRLIFPGVPDIRIRKQLKAQGFKWSPTLGSWVRMITRQAISEGKRILEAIDQENPENPPENPEN